MRSSHLVALQPSQVHHVIAALGDQEHQIHSFLHKEFTQRTSISIGIRISIGIHGQICFRYVPQSVAI